MLTGNFEGDGPHRARSWWHSFMRGAAAVLDLGGVFPTAPVFEKDEPMVNGLDMRDIRALASDFEMVERDLEAAGALVGDPLGRHHHA